MSFSLLIHCNAVISVSVDMTGVGVGGLVSLVASVSIIAIVGRMTSHGLSIPAVGGAPGGLSVLLGDGGAARDLLQSTTTESLVHRIVRGGMIGLGGRIAAPLGHRITTGRTRLPTRSAGRSYTRFQNVSAPYTVTRLASAGTRVTSSGIPDTKTTAQLLRQSIDIPDSPGSTYVRDEATIGYGALTTTSALKTPATLEIIQKHPAKNLIGTASVTTQPYGVLPTFTDDKNKRQTNGQEQETHNDDVVTTDRSQESSVEFHYTTLTYTHQTNVRKRNVPSHTSSNNKIVTETLQTGDVTPVDIHVDTNMTDTQTGTESPTHTEWIDELTTEIFTGGETSVAQSTGSSGRGKTANGGSEATTTVETHSSAIVSTDIGENTRTVGLLNGDDTSAGGTDTSTRANALTNGAFTHHMVVDGASTIGPQYSSNHITIDAIDTVTTENNVSGVGISVVTRHPQSKGIQSMIKRDTTVALDHTTSTQRDNPSTMTAYSETTRARLIVKTGGNTTTSRLIKYNAQNSTIPTDAPSTIKETTYVIGQATTTTTDQVGNGKASAGVNVSIVNWGETTTGDATILASHKTEIVTTLPRSANSQDMSTRVTTQEVDISNEGNIVTFEPTVSNEKEAVSGFITEGNGRTRTSDVRGEPSTNEQTTTGNESGDTISDEHSATNAYTVRDPAYYATASYTPMEQSSTNSNVKFDLNPTTSSFETISDSTESTNNITTASIVHARYNMATRLALASEVSLSTHHPVTTSKTLASEVSLSTHYPATTSKTSPARNADSRRDLPTTTYRTPYAIHLVKAKPTQPIALVTHISPSQDIYGSKTGNSDAETNSVPTRDTITTEEVTSTINPTYLTRTLSDDEIATPSALYTSQSKPVCGRCVSCRNRGCRLWFYIFNIFDDSSLCDVHTPLSASNPAMLPSVYSQSAISRRLILRGLRRFHML